MYFRIFLLVEFLNGDLRSTSHFLHSHSLKTREGDFPDFFLNFFSLSFIHFRLLPFIHSFLPSFHSFISTFSLSFINFGFFLSFIHFAFSLSLILFHLLPFIHSFSPFFFHSFIFSFFISPAH